MSPLTLKRLSVVIISQAIGFVLGLLLITVGFNLLPLISSIQTPQGRSIAEYGNLYFLATAIPLGLIVMIWMDDILDTKILPD